LNSSNSQRPGLKRSQNARDLVKKIPGAKFVFEILSKWILTLRIFAGVLFSNIVLYAKPPFRFRGVRPKDFLVAITVSTNYADLLKICLEANYNWFDNWIVVTQESDTQTRNALAAYPHITVLFWDPKNAGAVFDKGSGVRLGQKHAYKMHPNSWYLLIDSDIVLDGKPLALVNELKSCSSKGLFGIERWDYSTLDDLKSKTNGARYMGSRDFHGYFQLYAKPYLYTRSKDASMCDMKFRGLFRKRVLLTSPRASHLGQESHWRGRKPGSEDFTR